MLGAVAAAAAATLDANSVALSEGIGSLAGEENGAAFLALVCLASMSMLVVTLH